MSHADFLAAVSWVLCWYLDPPTLIRGGSLCMAVSEPALSLGDTFVGVTWTYHHTGPRAGPWIRILVAATAAAAAAAAVFILVHTVLQWLLAFHSAAVISLPLCSGYLLATL